MTRRSLTQRTLTIGMTGLVATSLALSACGSAKKAQADAPTITFAVAGDTQAYGSAAAINTTGLGATGQVLAAADISMVNLETVVASDSSGLQRQRKQFTFLTSPTILTSLQRAGVDIVSAANNHGMDYGQPGLQRMLAVKQSSPVPILGIGSDAEQAYQPLTTTVKGRHVVVFAASDVLDPSLNWTATDTQPGMAYLDTPGGVERVEAGIKAARANDPSAAILVFLHWGSERRRCPSARQQELAQRFATAGANAVVGSHAHILQPTTTIGDTAVAFGLGNFVFGSGSGTSRQTGVLTLTIPAQGATTMAWSPALISGGLPKLLTGDAKQEALQRIADLDQGCGA